MYECTHVNINTGTLQPRSSDVRAIPLYENIQICSLVTAAGERSKYGNVKLSKHEPAAQYKISTNVAYGRVQR